MVYPPALPHPGLSSLFLWAEILAGEVQMPDEKFYLSPAQTQPRLAEEETQ